MRLPLAVVALSALALLASSCGSAPFAVCSFDKSDSPTIVTFEGRGARSACRDFTRDEAVLGPWKYHATRLEIAGPRPYCELRRHGLEALVYDPVGDEGPFICSDLTDAGWEKAGRG